MTQFSTMKKHRKTIVKPRNSELISVEHALGFEVLQQSGLTRFHWPQRDPAGVAQGATKTNASIQAIIRAAASETRCDHEALQRRLRTMSVADGILHLISHREFNFNSPPGVRSETIWRERIHRCVQRDEPIRLIYPLFCKIGNWAKQMSTTGVTAGEEAVFHYFHTLWRMVKRIYSPGIRFEVLADANLYNTALQNTPAESQNYLGAVRRLARTTGANEFVAIHDYAELLGLEASEFAAAHAQYYCGLRQTPDQVITPDTRAALYRSLRASINTRRLGLDYEDHRRLFGPDRDATHPAAELVNQLASDALVEQLSIKMAADSLNLPQRLWPDAIRVSCHKGRKHGRHVIGLRVFPSYYRCCRLLPYHGMTLLRKRDDGRWMLEVLPEVSLRGRRELVRVVNGQGETYCYVEETADVPAKTTQRSPNPQLSEVMRMSDGVSVASTVV